MRQFDVISASDYQGLGGGWGMISSSELEDLNKALTTSSGIISEHTEGGQALRVQSLEKTVRTLQYEISDLALWSLIPKSPAYSTTEEYTMLTQFGTGAGEGFIGELATPDVVDQNYRREVAIVKYLGIQKQTSLVSTLVRNQVEVEAEQVRVGTIELLTLVEQALLWGNDTVNSLSFKGLVQQILEWVHGVNLDGSTYAHPEDAEIIIDCEGGPLTEDLMAKAGRVTANRYGRLTDMIAGFDTLTDLTRQMFPKERFPHPVVSNNKIGLAVDGMTLNSGVLNFRPDVFFQPSRNLKGRTAASSTTAPAACTVAEYTQAVSAGVVSGSKLAAASYYYHIGIMVNGKEAITYNHASAAVVDTLGKAVTITISDAGFAKGSVAGTSMRVYRSLTGTAADARWMADVPKNKKLNIDGTMATDANTVYVDGNQWRPNTSIALALQNSKELVWQWKQLAPVMRLPLAITGTWKPFMCLIFGTAILMNPKRTILFKNIGSAGLD